MYVLSSDETWLLLIEGGVEVCAANGRCLVHDQPGKLIRITTDDVEKPVKWASLSGKHDVTFDDAFPFVVSPPAIDPEPIFTLDEIVLGDSDDSEDQERSKKVEAKRGQSHDNSPPPTLKKRSYREYRVYPREVHYRGERGRGRQVLKKQSRSALAWPLERVSATASPKLCAGVEDIRQDRVRCQDPRRRLGARVGPHFKDPSRSVLPSSFDHRDSPA